MGRAPSGWVRCRCGFESSPFKSSARRPSVEVYVPASRIDRKNAKVNSINNRQHGEVKNTDRHADREGCGGARSPARPPLVSCVLPKRKRRLLLLHVNQGATANPDETRDCAPPTDGRTTRDPAELSRAAARTAPSPSLHFRLIGFKAARATRKDGT